MERSIVQSPADQEEIDDDVDEEQEYLMQSVKATAAPAQVYY
jgi:hypothetical protein